MYTIHYNGTGEHVALADTHFATGTSLQGEISANYGDLLMTFGDPSDGDGYKVDAEWTIMTPDGIATIYNYKNGKNYNGEDGLAVDEITEWHIGGHNKNVVQWIEQALQKATQ